MSRTWRVGLFLGLFVLSVGACGEKLDPDDIEVSIEGYTAWNRVEPLLGPVPGHGDTYRIMYRNETALHYTGAGTYPLGSAIVKEIYDLSGKDGKGALNYTAVMRRMDKDAYPDLPITGGWLFTLIDGGSEETQLDSCWDSCHRSAPYVGAYFHHGY